MTERDQTFGAQWDTVYLNLARMVALRGTCPRAQVGAVLVRQGRPLSVGYNGAAPGMPHCTDLRDDAPVGCNDDGCNNAIHAELNAIAYAARVGLVTKGATLYCTHQPCIPCGQAIVSAGIVRVCYVYEYRKAFIFPDGMDVMPFYPWVIGDLHHDVKGREMDRPVLNAPYPYWPSK